MRYYFVATTIEIIPPFQDVPIHPNKVCSIECRMRTKLLLIAEPTSLTELEAHLTAAALPLHSPEPFGLSGERERQRGRCGGDRLPIWRLPRVCGESEAHTEDPGSPTGVEVFLWSKVLCALF